MKKAQLIGVSHKDCALQERKKAVDITLQKKTGQ